MAANAIIDAQVDEWSSTRRYEQFTVTIASPGVFTKDTHNLVQNDRIKLFTTGALPTGLTADTFYYVIYVSAHTFELASTRDGTAITTSGTQSGSQYYAIENAARMVPAFQDNR